MVDKLDDNGNEVLRGAGEKDSTENKYNLRFKLTNPEDIGNASNFTQAAGETISAVKAVYSNGTNLFLGDADTDFQHASIVGLTLTAGGSGTNILYQKEVYWLKDLNL